VISTSCLWSWSLFMKAEILSLASFPFPSSNYNLTVVKVSSKAASKITISWVISIMVLISFAGSYPIAMSSPVVIFINNIIYSLISLYDPIMCYKLAFNSYYASAKYPAAILLSPITNYPYA